jgi:hypothetical protein
MPGQIGTSIRANTRKIHSGDRESDAIDAAGLAQARERFALLGRDVSQLSDDQLRNLVSELERRFRDEGLTSATQAATIILEGVKANRWRILVRVDAHKIDEMVRQSPDRAYDIAFFDEFARTAGWTERLSLENPDFAPAELIPELSASAAGGYPRPAMWRSEASAVRSTAASARTDGRCLPDPAVLVGPDNDWYGWISARRGNQTLRQGLAETGTAALECPRSMYRHSLTGHSLTQCRLCRMERKAAIHRSCCVERRSGGGGFDHARMLPPGRLEDRSSSIGSR